MKTFHYRNQPCVLKEKKQQKKKTAAKPTLLAIVCVPVFDITTTDCSKNSQIFRTFTHTFEMFEKEWRLQRTVSWFAYKFWWFQMHDLILYVVKGHFGICDQSLTWWFLTSMTNLRHLTIFVLRNLTTTWINELLSLDCWRLRHAFPWIRIMSPFLLRLLTGASFWASSFRMSVPVLQQQCGLRTACVALQESGKITFA